MLPFCTVPPWHVKHFLTNMGNFTTCTSRFPLCWTQSTYRSRVEIGGECICPLSWSVRPPLYVMVDITEYTMWQRPLSGVRTIMMEKLAWVGVGGWCTPTPFHNIYHHGQSCSVCSSWEGRYTLPLFLLYPNILCGIYSERGWACTPHPDQAGLIFPPWWNVRQKVAISTLCVLCGAEC
jgi:hypothetical protein